MQATSDQRAMMVDVLSEAQKKIEEQKNPPISTKEAWAAIVINILSIPWIGWVLSVLWGWFILSLWPNAPHLSWLPAVGLAIVVNFFTYALHPERRVGAVTTLTYQIYIPAFLLVEGFIVHLALLTGWFGG